MRNWFRFKTQARCIALFFFLYLHPAVATGQKSLTEKKKHDAKGDGGLRKTPPSCGFGDVRCQLGAQSRSQKKNRLRSTPEKQRLPVALPRSSVVYPALRRGYSMDD
jgi:hypothetical protein